MIWIFLSYVMDTRDVGKKTVDDVSIIQEFPEEFPEVPPNRKVEFRINLILCTAPIAKAPYRLAPPQMHEFSTQM